MLFGRKKPGFVTEEAVDDNMEGQEKQNLLDYLEELPDVEDGDFGNMEIPDAAIEAPPLTEAQRLADYIRLRTQGIELTAYAALLQEVEQLDELIAEWEGDETCRDIVCVAGNKDRYYYSSLFMSDNYAMIASLVEEKDLPRTIAKMVRFNCQTYPVPTPYGYFERSPYLASRAQIERAVAVMEGDNEFQDIKTLKNNLGELFFYSVEHMSLKYAKALADVDEYTD